MPIYCIVPDCGAISAPGSYRMFHLLPRDPHLCREWLEAMGLKLSEEEVLKKRTSYRVCSDHFGESSYETRRALVPDARPSLRLRRGAAHSLTSSVAGSLADIESLAETESLANTETRSYDTNMQVEKEYLEINDEYGDRSEKDDRSTRTEEKELDMRYKLETRIYEPDLCNAEAIVKMHISNEQFLEFCNKFLGVRSLKFIKCQMLLKTRNKHKGDVKFRRFCLNLYNHNPQAYAILQNFVGIPSIKILRRTYISIYPGYVNPQCMQLLESIVGKMKAKDKCCVVGIGSTSLKKHVYYDIRNDKIHGLHQVDDKPLPKVAKRAFVLIVRGLLSAWRLPVAYALFSESDGYALVVWADAVLQTLLHIGLDVRAFIANPSDEESKRTALLKRIDSRKNFFILTNKRIYYIFDVRHLIRSLRDSFMNFHFKIGSEVAKWDHILTFYNAEVELQTHLAPRLTDAHVNPDAAQRANAALAVQLFSQSLATAMALFVRLKLLDDAATATVKLVSTVNDIFDLLNSNKIQHNTPCKGAYTGEKWQKKFLKETIDYFHTVKRDTNDEYLSSEIEAIEGFIVTMKSVKNLWKDLSKDGFAYLLTKSLNIQFVDDFFLRLNFSDFGTNESQLTSIEFNRFLYKSFIDHIIKNSKLNSSKVISPTLALLNEYVSSEAGRERSELDSESLAVGEPDYRISLPETNTIQFIAGYLMRKALDKHRSCKHLMKYLNPSESETKQTLYIDFEYFEEHSMIPKPLKLSVEFIAFVMKMEERFLEVFRGERLPQRAGAAVLRASADLVVLPCRCFPLFLIKKLFVRLRIYNTLKIVNRQLRLSEENDAFVISKLDL